MDIETQNLLEHATDVDNLELAGGSTTSKGVGATLQNVVGNPTFKAQFDINVKKFVTDQNYQTNNVEQNLPSAYKIGLPFALFGQSDKNGGYANFRKLMSDIGDWVFEGYEIKNWFGTSSIPFGQTGDMIFKFKTQNNQYFTILVVSCKQVAYGTLLASTSSDTFEMNSFRYSVDPTKTSQFENQVKMVTQSLFGKIQNDDVSPISFKRPEQNQDGIVDIPLKRKIYKEQMFMSYMDYQCSDLNWSIFVDVIQKLK